MAQAFARPDPFFDLHNKQFTSLTSDDVLLMPQKTDIYPEMTDVAVQITRNIRSKISIFSAAMDKVTEDRMAIALAKAGGIGVIHRLLTPEAQAKQIERVHYEVSKLIRSPITKPETMTVQELLDWLAERKKNGKTVFDTHPIVDADNRLVGLVGGKEIRYCCDKSVPLGKIMTRFDELVKGRPGMSPEEAYAKMMKKQVSALPLVDSQRRLQGMYLLTDLERKFSSDGRGYNLDENGQLIVAGSVGTSPQELVRVEALIAAKVNLIVVDTAHGHSEAAANMIKAIRQQSKYVDVMAGNVATEEGARFLAEAGADAIKVGIGPGSICTTRIVAGIGVPQLSAVHSCARAVRKFGIPVCADGGVRSSGDSMKLLAIKGVTSIMIGSLLAGTDESPGELRIVRGREVKEYRGMGSEAVMAVNADRYRQKTDSFVAEGIETSVAYRGSVARVVGTLVNGIRTGLGYNGAHSIEELQRVARFTRITNNGLVESYPHDVLFYDN